MIRVSRIILFVKNMTTMLEFYETHFGLRRQANPDDTDGFVSLDAGSVQLSRHQIPPRYAKNITITDPPEVRQGMPCKIVFEVENVEAMREILLADGVNVRTLEVSGAFSFCDGIDPEGNVFQISNRL